ncbi:hypothetical protein X797_012295 [Metarhizium robertsii]|uniref:Up-regulated during septation protein 1 domain-containing protein n=1 Tax=Metarhizium robertsii TaxID=568076 RepID=A0A014N4Q4_9HYPO|nr:hypothetical protein X797_012295 [Metarhizium robertsii]
MKKSSAVKRRKYTLFPKIKKSPMLRGSETLHPAKPFSIESNQNAIKDENADRYSDSAHRIIGNGLVHRGKICFPKSDRLATIQEVDMDSSTIPCMQLISTEPCSQQQPVSLTTPQQNTYKCLRLSDRSGSKLQPGSKPPMANPCESVGVNEFPGRVAQHRHGALLSNTLVPELLVYAYSPTSLESGSHQSHIMLYEKNRTADAGSVTAPGLSQSMDMGRPRKKQHASRNESSMECKGAELVQNSKEKSFKSLPKGLRPREAGRKLGIHELRAVYSQAVEEAKCFEELRYLDERAEYLRHTYKSLRSGRCGLQQSRKCDYFQPRHIVRSSHESMLRREEALAKLDASIDDWFTRLEQAENRRTRIRQKLLEHIAAATMLFVAEHHPSCANESLQHHKDMQLSPRHITAPYLSGPDGTPPSGRRAGSTLSRRHVTLAHHGDGERLAAKRIADNHTDVQAVNYAAARRYNKESGWIPQASDVEVLIDNLEKEVSKMGNGIHRWTRNSRLERERLKSYEKLCGGSRHDRISVTL